MKNKLILIIIFFIISFNTNANDKVLFEIEGEIYTTIDLNNRIKYLEIIGQNNQKIKDIYQDFKHVVLFDFYANKNNIKVNKEELKEYLSKIKDSNKDYIYQNLVYDLQKKNILEKKLWNKDIKIINQSINDFDIHDYKIQYITLNKKYENILNKITNNKKNIKYKKIKNLLSDNKIQYANFNKNVKELENLDIRIKQKIKERKHQFIIEFNDFIMIGMVEKKLKENVNTKITFYQIVKAKNKKKESLNCKNIPQIINDSTYKIKKFKEVDIKKLNKLIRENLNHINDLILISKSDDSEIYILLCEIKLDKKILNDQIYNNKLKNIVDDIENQIIKNIKNEFKLIEYE